MGDFDSRSLLEYLVDKTAIFLVPIIVSVWATRMEIKYENIKRHMTKRIKVKVTSKMGRGFYRCAYHFSGLDEYEGITFYDPWLAVWARHKVGETVFLLVNEYNLKEFWFEEAERISYRRTAVFMWIITFLGFVLMVGKFLLNDIGFFSVGLV